MILYGHQGKGGYTLLQGKNFIPCDNHLGDFARGHDKTCAWRAASPAEFPPMSGYRSCATFDQMCQSGGTPDRPVWMRFGKGSIWSYALVSGNVRCHWSVAGDSLKNNGQTAECQIGPAYDKLPAGTTWTNLGSEHNEFSLPGAKVATLVRYGSGNSYAYRFVETGGQKTPVHCLNDTFAYDPIPGAKFCQMAVIPAGKAPVTFASVQGVWHPVASCSGEKCVASRSETVGVQSTSSKSKTKEWSQSLMVSIEKQFGVPTAAQTTLTLSSTTAFGGSTQVQDAIQRGSTGTNQLTCGPTPAGPLHAGPMHATGDSPLPPAARPAKAGAPAGRRAA